MNRRINSDLSPWTREDDEDDRSDDHLLTFSNDNAGYYDEGFDEDAKEEAERGYQEQEYRQRADFEFLEETRAQA